MAIKVMLPGRTANRLARERFLREMAVTAELVHPNIVRLLAQGSDGEQFFFVMELCSGGSVDRLIQQHGGKLPLAVAAPIMRQCLAGLDYAHRLRFIHRDLKPHNVLLDRRAERFVAKIADFGLAKSLEQAGLSGMTATGSRGGTLPFMPREQLTQFKYVQPVSDVWSMAATFYNMLTGKYPLEYSRQRDPLEVLLQDDPVPIAQRLPDIPPGLAAVLDRALLTDPAKRYPTAGEMRGALEGALAPLGV